MSKTIKVNIPKEFTIEHYDRLGKFEHLTEAQKIIRIVSAVSGQDEEDVRTWDLADVQKIYNDIHHNITNVEPIFLPIFEFKGIKYGLQPLSKMTAGEYIDLDSLARKGSILDVISILYRPIVEDRLGGLEWKIKSNLKYIIGKAESLFKYYKLEEYDTEKRDWRKDIFKDLPMAVALGAYNFFLLVGLQLSRSMMESSNHIPMKEKKQWMQTMDQLLASSMGGSTHSTISRKMGDS